MSTSNGSITQRLGYMEGIVSSGVNLLMFGVKLWSGMATGSVAMVADAWHTLSDTVTSVAVIMGFWVAGRPADEKHSFGHGRAEAVVSIVIGTLLGVVGATFLWDSVQRLAHRSPAVYSTASLAVFGVSAVIKEALAQFAFWAGRRTGALSLVADGWHHRSDAVASALIVAGALAAGTYWWLDGVMGAGVSLLIMHAAWSVVTGSASALMGESPSSEQQRRIREVIVAADGRIRDDGVHHLHVHRYGEHEELTVHIRMPDGMSVAESHDIATRIESCLRVELGTEATIHVEPDGLKTD
jgi:cation diffusion facilitator family transporter